MEAEQDRLVQEELMQEKLRSEEAARVKAEEARLAAEANNSG